MRGRGLGKKGRNTGIKFAEDFKEAVGDGVEGEFGNRLYYDYWNSGFLVWGPHHLTTQKSVSEKMTKGLLLATAGFIIG